MEKITFIINPISGHGKKKTIEKNIKKYLDSRFLVDIKYTEAPRHAIELSRIASEDSDIVVAVGGDGSIHEVAQSLVSTNTKLAIIPMGSGNGLARHLKIPLDVKKALDLINQSKSKKIDVLDFGDSYGFNVSGIGFDAHIAHEFSNYHKRGFVSYLKISLTEFLKYKPKKYSIQIDDKEAFDMDAFSISMANSSQFGNNAFIAPNAIIDDGFFELVIISPFRKRNSPALGIKLFTKQINKSRFLNIYLAKKITIKALDLFEVHKDGEAVGKTNTLSVKIKSSALEVIIP